MATKLYRKYVRSRSEFPTHQPIAGHKAARLSIERDLRRPLREGTRLYKQGGNWVFCEPKLVPDETGKPIDASLADIAAE